MSQNPPIDYLHPEILSKDTLLRILSERRIKIEGLERLSRGNLLEMYQQYCLPLAQRKRRADNDKSSSEAISKTNICRISEHAATSAIDKSLSPGMKKIKLSDNEGCKPSKMDTWNTSENNTKRKLETSNGNDTQSKRQKTKITWP